MSAIAGVIAEDDARTRVAAMLEHQTHRGPDGLRTAMIEAGSFGHCALHTTPESQSEQQPLVHGPTQVALTGDIRLDNRRELCALLDMSDTPELGDGELLLHAYLRWGVSVAARLLGAYAFAIWDARTSQLVLGRDHLGIRPLYYALNTHSIVFASTVDAVALGSNHDHPLNLDKAIQAILPGFEGADETATALHGVMALPRATVLTWSPGGKPHVSSYWEPAPVPPLHLKSDHDYDEAFAEAFARAVRRRTRSLDGVASMLSGGLDSSAVTAAALRASGPAELVTVSAIASSFGPGDDTGYVRDAVEYLDVRNLEVDAAQIASAHDLDAILSTSDSLAEAGKPMLHSMIRLTHSAGRNIVLSGVGSDEMLGLPVATLVRSDLARRRIRSAFTESTHWDGSRTLPIEFARALALRAVPRSIQRLRTRLRGPSRLVDEFVSELGITSARVARLRELHHELTLQGQQDGMDDRRVRQLTLPHMATALGRYDRIGARCGVEVRHPFADRELIEFLLSLPHHQLRDQGWSKSILRRWAARALPRTIAYRPKNHNALGHIWLAMVDASGDETRQQHPEGALCGLLDPLSKVSDDPLKRADINWTRAQLKRWNYLQIEHDPG